MQKGKPKEEAPLPEMRPGFGFVFYSLDSPLVTNPVMGLQVIGGFVMVLGLAVYGQGRAATTAGITHTPTGLLMTIGLLMTLVCVRRVVLPDGSGYQIWRGLWPIVYRFPVARHRAISLRLEYEGGKTPAIIVNLVSIDRYGWKHIDLVLDGAGSMPDKLCDLIKATNIPIEETRSYLEGAPEEMIQEMRAAVAARERAASESTNAGSDAAPPER